MLIYSLNYYAQQNDVGLALTSDFENVFINSLPLFGQRNRQNITNVVSANYIFNNKMDIALRIRHYWAKISYHEFYTLNTNGLISAPLTYIGNDNTVSLHNNNYNAFTIDMVYSWFFLPGSQINIVWKNSVFNTNPNVDLNYIENTTSLSTIPFTNSLSIKLLYFIDYWNLKSNIFKR